MSRLGFIKHVEECVARALELAGRVPTPALEGRYAEAYDKSRRALKGYLDAPLVGIEGPPGSGKTMIVERLAEDYIVDLFGSRERELLVYVAPTNELVYSACVRVLAKILWKLGAGGRDECSALEAVMKGVRVLGYKIKGGSQELIKPLRERCKNVVSLKEMTDLEIGDDVVLVFTTEFQRPYFKDIKREVKLIVDESSKSPYFRAFIPIVRKLAASKYEDFPAALVALGDPQQAISVESYGKDILLMNVVRKYLQERNLGGNYVPLDKTYRLPRPSEWPISFGFYEGRLHAHYSARERINASFNAEKVLQMLNKHIVVDTYVERVVKAIEEAINGRIPLVWLDVPRFQEGDTYDPLRAKLAFVAGAALALGWPEAEVGVNAIYTDVVQSVRYSLARRGLGERLTATTVQSMIGDERDVIVAVLGKEYSTEEFGTMYYREPELLNVQLSRHRRLMVGIGCLSCLKRFKIIRHGTSDYRIVNTGDKIDEMRKTSDVVYERVVQ